MDEEIIAGVGDDVGFGFDSYVVERLPKLGPVLVPVLELGPELVLDIAR